MPNERLAGAGLLISDAGEITVLNAWRGRDLCIFALLSTKAKSDH